VACACFQDIEEIKDVPGIAEKKFEAIKELITVY
jgi:DNA uptake protein ComE-like DNA-binding protein